MNELEGANAGRIAITPATAKDKAPVVNAPGSSAEAFNARLATAKFEAEKTAVVRPL